MTRLTPTIRAEKYIDEVLAGKRIVSDQVLATCKRHKLDLEEGPSRGLRFDPVRGSRLLQFVEEFCHHSQGEWAGQKVVLADWQCALLYILYGWRWAETGYRRFKFGYVELAKGNGKSFLASALALYELIGSGEPGAEVYSVATKKDQARIVFNEAERMVKQSPALKSRIKNFRDSLVYGASNSKFQPLSSDEDSLDGPRPSCIICDELHAWGISARKLWDVLSNALGKRRSPLFLVITTSGSGRESLCFQQHEYSEKVNAGIHQDDTWFSWICCISDEDNWEDPACWIKSNPNLGVSVKQEELAGVVNKAKGDPASLNGVLRLRLGRWTENISTWMDMPAWDACGTTPIDFEALTGRPCYAGLDLATVNDTASFTLVFPPTEDVKIWTVVPNFFLPEDNIAARVRKDRVNYDVWARRGLFNLTPGNVIDYDFIRAKIQELAEIYDIKEIAFDRWNSSQLVTQLMGDGFEMVKFGQGFESMGTPTKRLMELVLRGELAHGGNPVLRWQASNVVVHPDPSGAVKPDKGKSREKIDGIVAAVMAIGRASLAPDLAPLSADSYFMFA
jgi:phage terminase large subunit-like protein